MYAEFAPRSSRSRDHASRPPHLGRGLPRRWQGHGSQSRLHLHQRRILSRRNQFAGIALIFAITDLSRLSCHSLILYKLTNVDFVQVYYHSCNHLSCHLIHSILKIIHIITFNLSSNHSSNLSFNQSFNISSNQSANQLINRLIH